ncbi:MAG: hypothetical protein I8H71_00980 [Xanthomonadaceae bacterium]|nr:hypothetical protein [Xanthomonadaceae bacterium]
MEDFVTIEEAQDHLSIDSDSDADEQWLFVWIPIVCEAVRAWLKDPWRPYEVTRDAVGAVVIDEGGNPKVATDREGKPIVLQRVRAAVLIELAKIYAGREGEGTAEVPEHWGYGYVLGAGATRMLAASRKPTVA